ncbi:glycosyl hydrolase family 30 [bacterium]|nr:MAG: glycosyl hydrolase family 30 [bacterium]
MSYSRAHLSVASVFVSIGIVSSCQAQVVTAPMTQTGRATLHWKSSTVQRPWIDKPDVVLNDYTPVPPASRTVILVNSKRQQQVVDGWGGCFNERGQKAMEALAPAQREELMRSLFDSKTGLKLNYGRTPIGASDYATTLYSLNETAGDYSMKDFSIERDKQRLIPYIKAALAIRPDMKMWAVPWSPPSWMKDNNSLVAGKIKDDPKTLDALALYFARYIQAYKKEGINIGMVMPQNEPNMATNYTSCLWTGEQFAKFVGYHLGPQLKKEGIKSGIFLGTFNESNRGGYAYWVGPSMQDPKVRQYVSGVGCQWAADSTMAETRFLYPDIKLMQTEAECGNTNSNDWGFAEYQYQLAKKWFGAGANSNMIWNLVLDETGLSTGGWAQCSPIVVDTRTKKIIYTPYYYGYKHFSYFVQPGAHVLDTQSFWGDRVAFVNPNGEVVVVVGNSANTDLPVSLNIDGRESQSITLPAHSFNTFTVSAKSR